MKAAHLASPTACREWRSSAMSVPTCRFKLMRVMVPPDQKAAAIRPTPLRLHIHLQRGNKRLPRGLSTLPNCRIFLLPLFCLSMSFSFAGGVAAVALRDRGLAPCARWRVTEEARNCQSLVAVPNAISPIWPASPAFMSQASFDRDQYGRALAA